jgi:DNA polymerase-3 subunit delta
MKFEQIISDLKNQIYYPIYLLSGEEAFFIDEISDFIEANVLNDGEKEFNQTILYGKETDVPTIVGTAKRFPMMSNYQVVIVKEAQEIRKIEELANYAAKPLKSTLLVLCYKYKKFDKRKIFAKIISKSGILFESPKLYENKIPDWINTQLHQKNLSIRPKAALMLTEFLGTDLSKIANEIEKLAINLPKGTEITDAIIEENIGISKDYNVFELQNALGKKNILKANQIINYFAANQKDNPMIKVVGVLHMFFSKLLIFHYLKDKSQNSIASALSVNPFFVRDYQTAAQNYSIKKLANIVSLLREYDLKSKGVNNISSSNGELMKELVFKILH